VPLSATRTSLDNLVDLWTQTRTNGALHGTLGDSLAVKGDLLGYGSHFVFQREPGMSKPFETLIRAGRWEILS
jgi:hypothetical protein